MALKNKSLKTIFFAISLFALFHTPKTSTIDSKIIKEALALYKEEASIDSWQNITKATFLLLAGGWLAQKQIPRLNGQEVYFESPQLTTGIALAFLAIGIMGVVGGITQLALIAQKRINNTPS